ncbi:MAG TPA: chorismate mutase, partial [Luteibaculaceae bacterium]|nr:chorismate mutase [Luteibaculaceae bacterium]
FKQELPQTPLICDPSHIAGKRDLLALVAQRALDLDYQGLMIESHVNPDQAWTDAKQQVTPENLAGILGSLVSRKPTTDSPSLLQALDTLRSQIDQIDEKIMHAMAERMQVVAQIGSYKRQHGVTILQVNRWDEMVKKRSHMGDALGLYPGFTRKMLEIIHAESIRRQNEVMNPSYVKSHHQPIVKSA